VQARSFTVLALEPYVIWSSAQDFRFQVFRRDRVRYKQLAVFQIQQNLVDYICNLGLILLDMAMVSHGAGVEAKQLLMQRHFLNSMLHLMVV
jgi:hypothetical protein